MNILFVCTGNTCRSPMAQAMLQSKSTHHVQSAGIFATKGMPAAEGTIQVLKQNGISFDHQSQAINKELLEWSDIVLTMTQSHRDMLKQQYQFATEKIFTVIEYSIPHYEKSWKQLKELYAEIEEKKLSHLDIDQASLNRVTQLEKILQNVDIADPFGGDIHVYEKTYQELNKYLALLLEKGDNRHS